MRQSKSWRFTVMFLLIATFVASSCKKPAPPPPPPLANNPVTPPPPEPTIALRIEPGAVNRGQPAMLTWESRNAASVTIDQGIGVVSINGTRQVTPEALITYIAEATGSGGTARGTARLTVNVPVTTPAPPPVGDNNKPKPPAPNTPGIDQLFTQNVHSIFFDYDQSDIRPDQMRTLQANATWLKTNPSVRFTIE